MSYFKVPIDKLLKLIPTRDSQPIVFNESQWAMVNGLSEKRFWVHIAARRTGKSYAAAILAIAKLLEPNQQVTVVAPNFTLSSIIWDYVTEMVKRLEIESEKWNEKERVIKLINGSVFRLLSANNRDSLVGRAANLLIIDEAAVIDNDEYFQRDLRPALSTFPDSRALFISTPRGQGNYLYDYFKKGQIDSPTYEPTWGSAVYTWRANPRLSVVDIEDARKTLSKQLFQQEYECSWITTEGRIYDSLDAEKHQIDLNHIKRGDLRYQFIAGLDIGYRDETAFVVIAFDGHKYFVVDEYVSKEAVTSVHAEHFRELMDEWGVENIYIDSAAAQMKADLAYEYDIYCDGANKNVKEGIAFLQVLCEQDRIFFDLTKSRHTFDSMSNYRWNDKTVKEQPLHDKWSHASDAVRYACYSHNKNIVNIYGGVAGN